MIERGWREWLRVKGEWIKEQLTLNGEHMGYNRFIPVHMGAFEAVFFPLIRQEVAEFIKVSNNHYVRKQSKKALPSGGFRSDWFEHPEEYGGVDCSISVSLQILQGRLEYLEQRISIESVDTIRDYFASLIVGIDVDWKNGWRVFWSLVAHWNSTLV